MNHRRAEVLLLAILLGQSAGGIAVAEEKAAPNARAIRRSDVVFMYDNPAKYEAYGCTVMGWAGHADAKHIESAHAKGVRLFATSVGFRTEGRGVMDFTEKFLDAACYDFEGKPIPVPWLWDHKYKGHPFYWWCTNSPEYRRYLDHRLQQVAKAKPDGLHIDDYSGTAGCVTWLWGCFCPHCTAGFREYVAAHVPKAKLAELGIGDLARFEYREFLKSKGITPDDYKKRRWAAPLAAEFLDFQVKANTEYVAQYRRRAEELCGRPLALAVNSGLTDPVSLAIAPHLSYFCCEVGHGASAGKLPLHPIYVYKLADGLDRPVTSTASGQDWAFVMEHKRPGLARTWTALSYAFGHNFMAPHRQWCYTEQKGTHWYEGPTEEFAWLYQFVRQSARLLDGYEAVAPVAVVYDNAARRKGRGNIEPITAALASRNVPFTVVMAGDDWLPCRLEREKLSKFKAVVVTKELDADEPQRKLIDEVRAQGRLVVWPDEAALAKLVPAPVKIEGSDQVMAVPRAIPGDVKAPAIVHLLNRQYDPDKDAMTPQKDFAVRLHRDLFADRAFAKAMLHAPRAEPVPLAVAMEGDDIVVKVPVLDLWGIVELTQ